MTTPLIWPAKTADDTTTPLFASVVADLGLPTIDEAVLAEPRFATGPAGVIHIFEQTITISRTVEYDTTSAHIEAAAEADARPGTDLVLAGKAW